MLRKELTRVSRAGSQGTWMYAPDASVRSRAAVSVYLSLAAAHARDRCGRHPSVWSLDDAGGGRARRSVRRRRRRVCGLGHRVGQARLHLGARRAVGLRRWGGAGRAGAAGELHAKSRMLTCRSRSRTVTPAPPSIATLQRFTPPQQAARQAPTLSVLTRRSSSCRSLCSAVTCCCRSAACWRCGAAAGRPGQERWVRVAASKARTQATSAAAPAAVVGASRAATQRPAAEVDWQQRCPLLPSPPFPHPANQRAHLVGEAPLLDHKNDEARPRGHPHIRRRLLHRRRQLLPGAGQRLADRLDGGVEEINLDVDCGAGRRGNGGGAGSALVFLLLSPLSTEAASALVCIDGSSAGTLTTQRQEKQAAALPRWRQGSCCAFATPA